MLKNCLVGRPLKWTRKKLIEVIQDYLENTPKEEWTVTGIALVVGGKQLFQNYGRREEFKDIIEESRNLVEESYELSLRKHGRSGDIFALKNFGWKDKTEVDTNIKLQEMPTIKTESGEISVDFGEAANTTDTE